MNRILYEADEVSGGRVVLSDVRAAHIRNVLKSKVGDRLKMGEVDGPLSEGRVGDLSEQSVTIEVLSGEVPKRPLTDLILALPRPKVLNRLLPQIAALGVDRLVLCNASKVERFYFDSHVLEPEHLRKQLIEGLMQCGDTCLPQVEIKKSLRHFLEDEAEEFAAESDRWILHPGAMVGLGDVTSVCSRSVLAIGPEGGWLESEVEGFEACGFQRVSLTDRILRSDTATIAALALVTTMRPVL